jgi:ABC-type lipoprotein release transport system permease subunit
VVSVVGAVVVGVPLGIAVGRVAWRSFATRLGVLTSPHTPIGWVVLTALGAVVLAVLAGALPARSAARTRPAVTLRTE